MVNTLINTKDPTSTISEEPTNSYPFMNLHQESQVPGFGIVYRSEGQLNIAPKDNIDQFITPLITIKEYHTISNWEDPANSDEPHSLKSSTILDIVSCDKIKDSQIISRISSDPNVAKLLELGGICPEILDED